MPTGDGVLANSAIGNPRKRWFCGPRFVFSSSDIPKSFALFQSSVAALKKSFLLCCFPLLLGVILTGLDVFCTTTCLVFFASFIEPSSLLEEKFRAVCHSNTLHMTVCTKYYTFPFSAHPLVDSSGLCLPKRPPISRA